ncbi:MAG: pilus assembly protein PilM [Lachnospiraceae bacterium]|nr:pilus assembly protein PilM [Lachnospiraceae bacterium]MDD3615034.1 pilus assembly protein PilM [Lachnospiraceae bacterium]
MVKLLAGIEIGNYSIKIAVCNAGRVSQFVAEPLPDNIVREGSIVSWEAMADFIKETIKKYKINCKQAAVVLPDNQIYLRRLTMPLMTIDQLKVNLPYEFHDYINEDIDKYFFDYAMIEKVEEIDENEKNKTMELLAAAVKKSTIDQYKSMFRRAGMKLVAAEPEASAYGKVVREHRKARGIRGDDDYGILNLGHESIRIDLYSHGIYDTTRILEVGCETIVQTICELYDVDRHIALVYLLNNQDNVWEREECMSTYNNIAIEVMRVMNFYNFNHPDNSLDTLYYCGGGAYIEPMLREIQDMIEPKLVGIEQLFPADSGKDTDLRKGPSAVAITME